MRTPVFEEFDPASDCDCAGCAERRLLGPRPAATGAASAARPLIVVATAATVLGAAHAPPAAAAPHAPAAHPVREEPDTPQGGATPLNGAPGRPAAPATTRADIINRAKKWVAEKVPYSMTGYWSDGYRQDCSGFVSMAWNLPGNEWTGTLDRYAVRISKDDLQPGDILLFHNPADPQKGSHVVIFGGWTDYTHSYYTAYEQTRPRTRRQATPYAYWSHSDSYVAYRYKGVTSGTPGAAQETPSGTSVPFPGHAYFGPGANNSYVTLLGRLLVERGAARFYTTGPGPRWTDTDRRATQAFQLAQGWKGAGADGIPGPDTWGLLAGGKGRDIPALAGTGAAGTGVQGGTTALAGTAVQGAAIATGTSGAVGGGGAAGTGNGGAVRNGSGGAAGAAGPVGTPSYPGRATFLPGADNDHITRLGRQLIRKGYGRFYTSGPGPRWGPADRRAVEAFQRAQGWRGAAADGYPGPETWRRLFS